jgi:two-component system response regulator FixJ
MNWSTTSNSCVHVIDDDDPFRQMMLSMLASVGFLARLYSSANEFAENMASAPAGCVLTDVRMPGMSGIELVHLIKSRGGRFPVIVTSGAADIPLAVDAMKAGAVDFLQKPFRREALTSAINSALEQAPVDAAPRPTAHSEAFASLTPRQNQVLQGVLAGKPNKVIAYELGISARTVDVYRAAIMSRTHARSLSELVRMAVLAAH